MESGIKRIRVEKVLGLLYIFIHFRVLYSSPDGWLLSSPSSIVNIEIKQDVISSISQDKNCYFRVKVKENVAIDWSPLGVNVVNENFISNLSFVKDSIATIDETYSLPSGKRSTYRNYCNELTLLFNNVNNKQIGIVFRAYDDAVAFRYEFRGSGTIRVSGEISGFTIPNGSTGWGHNLPGDEKTYDQFEVGASAISKGIPILFKTALNIWILVTEAAVYGDYTGSLFSSKNSTKNIYQITFPQGQGTITGTLPWKLPWRVAIVGTLGTIVESSVVENLNPPCTLSDISWIKSGRSSWSWLSQETGDINQQKRYIDFASQMGWEYNLIDWNFDKSKLSEICQYGVQKNVGNELWYNYTEVKTQSQQESVFSQCRSWGLKGVKIDFIYDNNNEYTSFNQNLMKWYEMTANNLAKYKLMVTYHGCTVPRGERRRWPHLMTWEGVLGYEWIGRGYPGPKHNCTLPFTRNVIGPMDHTPILFTLGQLTNGSGSSRESTDAHELALSVIYESGIQHFADKPDSYNSSIGKSFLQMVPSSWDDIKFIDGYPGEKVILARRNGKDWYVAGISAQAATTWNISLSFLKPNSYTIELFRDSIGGSSKYTMTKQTITINPSTPLSVSVNKNGGFCCRIPNSYNDVTYVNKNSFSKPKQSKLELYHIVIGKKKNILPNATRTFDLKGRFVRVNETYRKSNSLSINIIK